MQLLVPWTQQSFTIFFAGFPSKLNDLTSENFFGQNKIVHETTLRASDDLHVQDHNLK